MDLLLATNKYYITGTRRGLGRALAKRYGNVDRLEDCDIFINCKHDGFDQVRLLYKAAKMNKTIINIGSLASDYVFRGVYSIEKKALRDANDYLWTAGVNTTCINFGYIDTERSAHKDVEKMTVDYCVGVVDWIINQPYMVKELTVAPQNKML
jgi:NAD(P)-dependent dehydrogenase (short-subunit alcohol dehydrogenase family)